MLGVLVFGNHDDIFISFDICISRSFVLLRYLWDKSWLCLVGLLIWYKMNRITHYLDPIMPFQIDISWYCGQYQYFDNSISIYGAFQNRYCKFVAEPIWYIGLLHCTICFQLWAWHGHKSYKIDCQMDTRPQTICCVFILYLPCIISCPVGGDCWNRKKLTTPTYQKYS